VAPAVLGFTLGLRGFWDVVCLTYFVCCGISRLARFNVTSAALTNTRTGKVRHFEGTPIPTSVVIVLILAVLYRQGLTAEHFWLGSRALLERVFHYFALFYVASGSAMISTIKVPKI
jgi:CDP-diacylglycerol--serine O-phosphatidyltransferase